MKFAASKKYIAGLAMAVSMAGASVAQAEPSRLPPPPCSLDAASPGLVSAIQKAAALPCGITSPATVTGYLASPYANVQHDPVWGDVAGQTWDRWYTFWGTAGTIVTATVQDTQDLSCLALRGGLAACGGENLGLSGPDPSIPDGDNLAQPAYTGPTSNDGITITDPPGTISYRLKTTGTYWLAVNGRMGRAVDGTLLPTPFVLTLTASPRVGWPPPPCVVPPHLVGLTFASVKRRLMASHCYPGLITHVKSRAIPRNRVVRLVRERGVFFNQNVPYPVVNGRMVWVPGNMLVDIAVSRGR